MWAVILIVVAVLSIFVWLDLKISALFDLFAGRAYDMLPMVAGDQETSGKNGNLRGLEYRNKMKVLKND